MTEAFALGLFSSSAKSPWPGVVRAGRVASLSDLLPGSPDTLLAVFSDWQRFEPLIANAVSSSSAGIWRSEGELRAHLPFQPRNLLGAGANYRRHVIELIVDRGAGVFAHLSPEQRLAVATEEMDKRAASGKPFVWVGLPGALAGPDEPLTIPYDLKEVDWELELVAVIGKPARRVSQSNALDYVAGYTIANDITARELVDRPDARNLGMDWMACKSAPGFKIIGPYVTPARFVPDPQKLHIRLSLNGQVMQDEGTDDMIFGVAKLIEFVSSYVQLLPGDIIMTGSPSGNGTHYNRFLRNGDLMLGEIDGIVGAQLVRCVAEPPAT